MNITRQQAIAMINNSKGKIVSVVFVKRTTGELRKMSCRTEVKKGLKGVGMAYNAVDKKLITVYDVANQGYRNIATEGIVSLTMRGVRYEVLEK